MSTELDKEELQQEYNRRQIKPKKKMRDMLPVGKKTLTILHSNDIHGDFSPKEKDGKQVGGLALLSGYVQRCREKNDNIIYSVSGDMFRGSILDSDTNGLATIALMNTVGPDIVTLGNHEVDYGVEHLLLLEKCADFPIINANMFISGMIKERPMFHPLCLLNVSGINVLFIGLLTPEVISQIRMDEEAGKIIDVKEPLEKLKQMYASGKMPMADITVLLTHIGLAEDIQLAKQLDPAWKIDLIIGGHSHDLTEEPVKENGVTIVQAGTGTGQIGRFDIEYRPTLKKIVSCQWQYVPIDSDSCKPDRMVAEILEDGLEKAEMVNSEVITTFARELTHPDRIHETELGDLYASALKAKTNVDIALIGAGSIRTDRLGPKVTLGDFKTNFPYTDPGYQIRMTGKELKDAFGFLLHAVYGDEATGRLYHTSDGCEIEYNAKTNKLLKFTLNKEPLMDTQVYTVAIERFLYENMENLLGFPVSAIENSKDNRQNTNAVYEEILAYLRENQNLDVAGLNRLKVSGV